MITPHLFRRALRRSLQWRVLLLWWAALVVPGAIAALPAFTFLRAALDRSTRAPGAVASLDGSTFIEILRRVDENGAEQSIGLGLAGAALALLVLAPLVAGAMAVAARSDEPLPLSQLLGGAGELYGRMLRLSLAGLVPLAAGGGIAAGIVYGVTRINRRAIWESSATANLRNGMIASAAIVFVFHLLVDAARAHFAAEPQRRSALAALWSAVRLLVRRPLRMLAVGALGTGVGLGVAAVLMTVRLSVHQATPARIGLAWLLAQAAQVAVGWGRNTRIFGLTELVRADAALPQACRQGAVLVRDPARSGALR